MKSGPYCNGEVLNQSEDQTRQHMGVDASDGPDPNGEPGFLGFMDAEPRQLWAQ